MSTFVIADVETTEASLYGQFLEHVTATVKSYGGRFFSRGGVIGATEGDWTPKRIALLEFGSVEQVESWLNSAEYTALDDIRTKSSNINRVVVEGL